jgi:hypothetical protein
LAEHFDTVYGQSGRYCVIFISAAYVKKMWTRHERRTALARALTQLRKRVAASKNGKQRETLQRIEAIRRNPSVAYGLSFPRYEILPFVLYAAMKNEPKEGLKAGAGQPGQRV